MIGSGLNKALFRVEEVQQKKKEEEQDKHDFKAHLAGWSELARVWAKWVCGLSISVWVRLWFISSKKNLKIGKD